MRSLGSLSSHVTQETTTLATCLKLTPVGGTAEGYTNHDKDLVISGVTYQASSGYTPTDASNTSMLNVDNIDVRGLLDVSGGVTADDILAGKYDGAAVEMFLVNYNDIASGTIKIIKGVVGEITRNDMMFTAEVRSLTQYLQQRIVEVTSPQCRADLGDSRCKIRINPTVWQRTTDYTVRESAEGGSGSVVSPSVDNKRQFKCITAGTSGGTEPTWDTTIGNPTTDGTVTWEAIQALHRTGTVTTGGTSTFTDSALDEAADFWNLGVITWVTGNNAGRSMEVKDFASGGAVTLYLPMPDAIQIGDTFTIEAGCGKDFLSDCVAKYDNGNNNRSEYLLPGNDTFITLKK